MPHTEVTRLSPSDSPHHLHSTARNEQDSGHHTSDPDEAAGPDGAAGPELHARKLEALGRLSGCVAHDFNNLLTVILGATGSLLQTPPQGDPMEAIREIHDSALRARQLTRQILAASRPSTAKPQPLDVSERLRDLLGLLGRLLGDRMEVRHEFHPDLPRVVMDPGHLDQVVINLAVNARDAMEARGTLDVRATPHPGPSGSDTRAGVRIQVTDTGNGMDRQTQRRIFDPFFTTKEEEGGTGLGLATVLRIVHAAGGRLEVDSEPDQGTTVEVWLPAASTGEVAPEGDENVQPHSDADRQAPKSAPDPTRQPSARLGGKGSAARILLVEDDPAVRRLVGRALRRSGFQVQEASGMEEAVSKATSAQPALDLLVVDLMLPDGSGMELLEILRARDPDNRPPRTVLMSGYTRDEVAAEILSNPEVRFLAKPFQLDELSAVVRDALEMRPGHSA